MDESHTRFRCGAFFKQIQHHTTSPFKTLISPKKLIDTPVGSIGEWPCKIAIALKGDAPAKAHVQSCGILTGVLDANLTVLDVVTWRKSLAPSNKCIASSNKCLTGSNKKLPPPRARTRAREKVLGGFCLPIITILIKFLLLLVVRHLFLIANFVTSSKALVTSSVALVRPQRKPVRSKRPSKLCSVHGSPATQVRT